MWSKEKCAYVGGIIDDAIMCHSIRRLHDVFSQVEEDTGYSPEFLWNVLAESDRDEPIEKMLENVITVAYEFDY